MGGGKEWRVRGGEEEVTKMMAGSDSVVLTSPTMCSEHAKQGTSPRTWVRIEVLSLFAHHFL